MLFCDPVCNRFFSSSHVLNWEMTLFLFAALGPTVSDIDVQKARGVFDKTVFSMVIPEVEAILSGEEARKSVVLFGIEVCTLF